MNGQQKLFQQQKQKAIERGDIMADRIIQTETLEAIANAIRNKVAGLTDKIKVSDFALKISYMRNEFVGVISGTGTIVNIPYGCTKIGDWRLSYMGSLLTVMIPETVTSIGEHAFEKSSMTSLTIPSTVQTIGLQALGNNSNLVELIIEEGIQGIPDYFAYACNKLPLVDIPESCNTIGVMAFRECSKLATINIKNSNMTSIGTQAFYGIKSDAVINCAFSQGAVSGAPWGAPSGVTINYDVDFSE